MTTNNKDPLTKYNRHILEFKRTLNEQYVRYISRTVTLITLGRQAGLSQHQIYKQAWKTLSIDKSLPDRGKDKIIVEAFRKYSQTLGFYNKKD